MKKNFSSLLLFIVFSALVFFIYGSGQFTKQSPFTPPITHTPTSSQKPTSQPVNHSTTALVTRVIDGDTIELDTKQKVRYIGMNTPEIHSPKKPVECFGQIAAEENKKLVLGKKVRLEKDISETDRYGRLLRFVYVKDSSSSAELFVNDYLVRQGFAQLDTFPPDVKYTEQFRQAQQEAVQNNRGLWKSCPIPK